MAGGKFREGFTAGAIGAAAGYGMSKLIDYLNAMKGGKTGTRIQAGKALNVDGEYLIAWDYKEGVTGNGLQESITSIEDTVDGVFNDLAGRDAFVTSTTEGTHGPDSLHYSGDAIDLRTRDLSSSQINTITNRLRNEVGPNYDVIYHDRHIHIEYDPR